MRLATTTDKHWNNRAASIESDRDVNLMDVFQRELELEFICPQLKPDMNVLEVGCGNGFSTDCFRELVKHVDAFDFAANMVERAKKTFGEKNNRFIHDDILAPKSLGTNYDAVICIRVLINLNNLNEQKTALTNLTKLVKPSGLLILVEGFSDGYVELSKLRAKVGLEPVKPAAINFYSPLAETMSVLSKSFKVENEFHLGSYDYLTRFVYPAIVAPEEPKHNTNFSERCAGLAKQFNPDCFKNLSRMRGLVLRKSA